MARRRSGVLTVVAEMQRQQHRQQVQAQRHAQAAQRGAAAAYRQGREAEAVWRNEELERRLEHLASLAAATVGRAPFTMSQLCWPEDEVPFTAPAHLATPVADPDPDHYQVRPPRRSSERAAQAWQEKQQLAQQRYQEDLATARSRESQRLAELAQAEAAHEQREAQRLAPAREGNHEIEDIAHGLWRGRPDAVEGFFVGTLQSLPWPDGFPRQAEAAYDPQARQLVLTWQLPSYDIVPAVSRLWYVRSTDTLTPVNRPAGERRSLYQHALAGTALRVVAEVFHSDYYRRIDTVVLTGYANGLDPATGLEQNVPVLALTAARDQFDQLALDRVEPAACLEALGGQLSAQPDRLTPVRPHRLPDRVHTPAAPGATDDEDGPSLLEMDPIAFEELVADLLRAALGFQVTTTARSGDGGIDLEAVDPVGILGGRIITQVKRYRHTVGPEVVRELFGTLIASGADRALLVTTSGFGPGSRDFATGKPLRLIDGLELVSLLRRFGLPGRLD